MAKGIVMFLLGFASTILGLIVFLFVMSVLPAGPLAAAAGGVLNGLGYLFGEALPEIGRIALKAAAKQLGV
ncbi:MAG TPA: hypothetical protein VG276_28745 [Actinomycetes bacterium]|jgi:hypothetical protein|nr:hypothetical protein [Actinomycetes bacterium]